MTEQEHPTDAEQLTPSDIARIRKNPLLRLAVEAIGFFHILKGDDLGWSIMIANSLPHESPDSSLTPEK